MGPDVWQEYARNLANVVAPAVGDAGIQLWTGLALIMLVWTGTQMALAGGGVNMASIVRLVIVLSIPFGMLRFYVLPMPGVGLSVPDIITGMGGWLQSVIIADAGEDMRQELAALTEQMWRNIALHAGGEDAGVFARIQAMLGALSTVLFGALLSILMVVLLVVVWAVGQGQVIWAQLAITLAILLGPIFIPFLVMPPLSFLFWGWFRTILTYSLYAAVAAAIFRVTTQVGIQMLGAVVAPTGGYGTPEGAQAMMENLLLTLMYSVAALMASLKVGEFAQMLLSGAGGVSSSAGSRVVQTARMVALKGM